MIPTTFSRVEKIFAEPSLPDPLLTQEGASTINLNRISENLLDSTNAATTNAFVNTGPWELGNARRRS